MKKFLSALVACSVLAAGTAAWAGAKWDTEVYINQELRTAMASLGSVRNSSDGTQYFDVVNHAFNDGSPPSIHVLAQDSSGNFAFCWSNVSSIVDAANGVAPDAFVQINWDENGQCTYLLSRKASYTPPKSP
jgi:hypothetical protein